MFGEGAAKQLPHQTHKNLTKLSSYHFCFFIEDVMEKVFILGGYGYTGRLIARHLLQQTSVKVVIAGRNLDKAEALALQFNAEFPGERVSARCADAANYQSLVDVLAGSDFLVVAATTPQHAKTVVRAALAAKIDYLDVQLDARKLQVLRDHAEEIAQAGLCFITEAGFHPGLPSALVRYAAARLDRLDSAVTAGFLNMGHDLPYSEAVTELMQAFVNYQGQVYKDGAWTAPNAYNTRSIDFGGAIGKKTCTSMFFEETRDLPQMIPTLRETGFYIAGSHWFNDYVITMLVLAGLKIAPRRGLKPLGRLMWWGMQTFHKPPYIVSLRVDAQGEKDGQPVQLAAEIAHPDGYELTAIPVVATLMQMLDSSARNPGLWMMGHIAEPIRLFEDMQKMGAAFQEKA